MAHRTYHDTDPEPKNYRDEMLQRYLHLVLCPFHSHSCVIDTTWHTIHHWGRDIYWVHTTHCICEYIVQVHRVNGVGSYHLIHCISSIHCGIRGIELEAVDRTRSSELLHGPRKSYASGRRDRWSRCLSNMSSYCQEFFW